MDHTPNRDLSKPAAQWGMAGVLGLAAILRLPNLDRTSLWYDEAVSWSQSSGTLQHLFSTVSADNYPPLHNLLLWATLPITGDSETALRAPSAILGLLAVWLIYLAGRELRDRWTGLLAASLLAVSPFHIWYSTEARMYALLAATGLFFLLSVCKVLRNGPRLWLATLPFAGALFLYSHAYALFAFAGVGAVCGLYALKDLRTGKPLLWSRYVLTCAGMAGSVLLFLPWLVILFNRATSIADTGFWIAYPDILFLKTMAFEISGSLSLFAIFLLLSAFALWASIKPSANAEPQEKPVRAGTVLCAAYTFCPFILAYGYSALIQPILFDRYLIAAWPGLLLLASCGATGLIGGKPAFVLVPLTLYLSFGNLQFTLFEKVRPEWRQIAEDYLARRENDEKLLLFKGFSEPALAYYLRDPETFTPLNRIEDLKASPEDNTWLLLVHSNPQEVQAALEAFDSESEDPVAQSFGWGASKLSLYRRTPPSK